MTKKKCRFPDKDRLTEQEARGRAAKLRRTQAAWVNAYRCPAGGHWHVGHPLRGKVGRRIKR